MMGTQHALLTVLLLVAACGHEERSVTPVEAKAIADGRYVAHAKALGVPTSPIPMPTVQDRGNDTVFVYVEPAVKKRITVIVERSGQVADTAEPM